MATLGFSLAVEGKLPKFCQDAARITAQAVTGVVRKRVQGLKVALRKQVVESGLGARLSLAIRSETVPPRGTSEKTWGRVFSKAIKKRPGGFVDLLAVFEKGATIRAAGGKFLAIPTKAAGESKTPASYGKDALRFIPFQGHAGGGRLVAKDGDRDVTLFWLIRVAVLRPRLTMAAAYRHAAEGMAQGIADDMEKRAQRLLSRNA